MIGSFSKAARILCVFLFAAALSVSAVLVPLSARAGAVSKIQDEALGIRQKVSDVSRQYLSKDRFKGKHYAEERLIDGETFYRLKDYQRAAIIFMDVIETYPNHATYPDALFYFADSLFCSRDFYGARHWFTKLLNEDNRPGMARFRPMASGRLIEIAIHLNDFKGIEKYFRQFNQTPGAEAYYVRGKYFYFKGDYAKARSEFQKVTGNVELELKSKYFTAVSLVKEKQFDNAIEVFKSGAAIKAATSDEQDLVDLMNLGLGRLFYEKDFVENASAAYQTIGRYSTYYDTALYEAASVHIRAGNSIKAEAILEVLTLAVPDSKYIPRAKVLRGSLLLRSGRYDEAERVFEETIGEFEPVRERLDNLMTSREDPGQFFASLTQRSMSALDVSGALPPLLVKWVGEEPEVKRAFALSSDLNLAQEYTRETERLVRMLKAVIDGPSRINAVPNLRTAKRKCQQLSNRLVQLRGKLLKIANKKLNSSDAEVAQLIAAREALEKNLKALPTSDQDFDKREAKAKVVYQRMGHELARNTIRLDKLVAMVVALERFIQNPKYTDGVAQSSIDAVRDELIRHKQGVDKMRDDINRLRGDVEAAKYRIGVGDYLDQNDRKLRDRILQISQKEQAILRSNAGSFGTDLYRVFEVIAQSEVEVDRVDTAITQAAERQIAKIRNKVQLEQGKVKNYRAEIVVLKEETDEVVGGVTFDNFSNVRKKFHELVLKADVGIVDVAWMRKEEHKMRSSALTKDRLAEIQFLDEEFNAVKSSEIPAGQ